MPKQLLCAAAQPLRRAFGEEIIGLHRNRRSALSSAFAFGLVVAIPGFALAQGVTGGASPATMINNICTFILGPFGQSLAILGIIAIGLSWMFGRASLGLISGVIGGIIIMFGASYLGSTLTGAAGG